MIRSEAIRAYCIGVTNSLFTQKQDMIDINDNNEGQIDLLSAELKRQLSLTKQDLRFVDYLLKMVELRIDSAIWEGSDDWIRGKFHGYLLAMLASAKLLDVTVENIEIPEALDDEFNNEFLLAWRSKHNYRVWSCTEHADFVNISHKHPHSGQLNVNDVILRVNHSEPARRVISTLTNTTKFVSETGTRFKSWMKNAVNSNFVLENQQNPPL